ncbi:MAG: hypothetical protein AB7F74_15715, partial [Parvibaculaceae bacterium]
PQSRAAPSGSLLAGQFYFLTGKYGAGPKSRWNRPLSHRSLLARVGRAKKVRNITRLVEV